MTAKIINNTDSAKDALTGTISLPKSPFSLISGGGNFTVLAHDTMNIVVQMVKDHAGTFKDTVLITFQFQR